MRVSVIPVLQSARLRLRPITINDADAVQKQFPHWNIVQYLNPNNIPWPYPDDGAFTFLSKITSPAMAEVDQYNWALTLPEEGDRLIGVIGLYLKNEIDQRAFWIAKPYQGRGLMWETSQLVTEFAFETLALSELRISNAEPNTASSRIKQKSGAVLVGSEADVSYIGGKFRRLNWLLTRDAWQNARQADKG